MMSTTGIGVRNHGGFHDRRRPSPLHRAALARSLFVAYYAVQLVRAVVASGVRSSEQPKVSTANEARFLVVGGAVAAVTVVGAFVAADRDRFAPPRNGVVTIGVIAPTTGPY